MVPAVGAMGRIHSGACLLAAGVFCVAVYGQVVELSGRDQTVDSEWCYGHVDWKGGIDDSIRSQHVSVGLDASIYMLQNLDTRIDGNCYVDAHSRRKRDVALNADMHCAPREADSAWRGMDRQCTAALEEHTFAQYSSEPPNQSVIVSSM